MFYWEDYKSSGFDRSNLFYCGLQIRRDAWRWTFWNRQALSSARRSAGFAIGVKKCSTLLFCGFAIRLSNSLFHSSHHSLLSESIFLGFYILEIKF